MAKSKRPINDVSDRPKRKTRITKSAAKEKPETKEKVLISKKEKKDIIESLGEPIPITSGADEIEENGLMHFIRFRLEHHHFAFPLEQVERIIRMVAIVPLPDESPWMAGMINMHGVVVPVLDLRRRLGHKPKKPHPDDRLLVVRGRNSPLAFMVDEVNEVMELSSKQVESLPDFLEDSQPIRAVIRGKEDLVLVLDVTRLEPSKIKKKL